MKEIQVLHQPDDIQQYFYRKWKIDLFREEQQREGSFINKIVGRAARYPLFVYKASDHPKAGLQDQEKTEYRHFSSYWGGINDYPIRHPGIHDTYWLHELHHKAYAAYLPDLSFEVFREKAFRAEAHATIATMFEVHFHYPELPEISFEFDTLAKRFLANKDFMQVWNNDHFTGREQLYLMVREAYLRPNPTDRLEQQLYLYGRQVDAWVNIWSVNYNEVETHMDSLRRNIDSGADKAAAMDEFISWLQSTDISVGTEIPFPKEAEAFAAVYKTLQA